MGRVIPMLLPRVAFVGITAVGMISLPIIFRILCSVSLYSAVLFEVLWEKSSAGGECEKAADRRDQRGEEQEDSSEEGPHFGVNCGADRPL